MLCPHDQQKLAFSDENHPGYACVRCSGVWLPAKYVDSIKYGYKFIPEDFFCLLERATQREAALVCPCRCGKMHAAIFDSVEIDWCKTCRGIWLDSGELKKLLSRFPPQERAGAASAAGLAVDGGVGVLELLAQVMISP